MSENMNQWTLLQQVLTLLLGKWPKCLSEKQIVRDAWWRTSNMAAVRRFYNKSFLLASSTCLHEFLENGVSSKKQQSCFGQILDKKGRLGPQREREKDEKSILFVEHRHDGTISTITSLFLCWRSKPWQLTTGAGSFGGQAPASGKEAFVWMHSAIKDNPRVRIPLGYDVEIWEIFERFHSKATCTRHASCACFGRMRRISWRHVRFWGVW